jgi:hypothetical protein
MTTAALPSFANMTVERIRPALVEDSHGNTIRDWSTPDRRLIAGCWIGNRSGNEIIEGRQTVVIDVWLWMPPTADVDERDRISESDITYEVSGPVILNRGPGGILTHKSARLQVIEQ